MVIKAMQQQSVSLSVPAEPDFARSVRMMASNLAVVCNMTVDDVEDVRMAAEEGFVFSCATHPSVCNIDFDLSGDALTMRFSLGEGGAEPQEGDAEDDSVESLDLAELLLSAVCDEYEVSPKGDELTVVKRTGAADAR